MFPSFPSFPVHISQEFVRKTRAGASCFGAVPSLWCWCLHCSLSTLHISSNCSWSVFFFSFFLLCPSSTNLHHSSHLSPSRSHQPTCWHCFPFFTGPHFTSCPELILVIWRLHLLCACVCSWKGHQGSEWECECYHKEAKLKRGNCTGLFQADFEKELMLALRSDFTDSNVPGG